MPNVHAAFVSLSPWSGQHHREIDGRTSTQATQMISTSAYGTKWYITLFANSVPFATQLRLWDGLLLEGLDFLILTAVAIIWHFQRESRRRRVELQYRTDARHAQTTSPRRRPRSNPSCRACRPTSSSSRTTLSCGGSGRHCASRACGKR